MITPETYGAALSKKLGSHYRVLSAELYRGHSFMFKIEHVPTGKVAFAAQFADPKFTQQALPLLAKDCAIQLRIHFTGRP